MHHNEEARRGGCRGRAPECVLGKINPEFMPTLLDLQVRWLISGLPLCLIQAGLELAFGRRPA